MKAVLTFTDRGAQTVEFDMDLTVPETDTKTNRPTPASVLAMAVKAMFTNGMLARAGQIALEGASAGISPAEAIAHHYIEKTSNDNTDTRRID